MKDTLLALAGVAFGGSIAIILTAPDVAELEWFLVLFTSWLLLVTNLR